MVLLTPIGGHCWRWTIIIFVASAIDVTAWFFYPFEWLFVISVTNRKSRERARAHVQNSSQEYANTNAWKQNDNGELVIKQRTIRNFNEQLICKYGEDFGFVVFFYLFQWFGVWICINLMVTCKMRCSFGM